MENDGALENLRVSAEAGDSGATLALGDRCAERGEWVAAEEQYRRALELGNLEARYPLGRVLHDQQRLEEAETAYRGAVSGGDMRGAIALGNLLSERGDPNDFERAETFYRLALDAGEDGVLLNYANLLALWQGREDEAEHMYLQCLEEGEKDAHNNLGMMLRDLGRARDAEAQFRQAIAAGDAWGWYGLGMLLRDEARFDEAEEAFEAAITGGRMVARVDLADLYLEMDRVEDAEQVYRAAIAAGDTESHLHLGILYQELDRLDEAEHQYRAAISAGIRKAHIELGNLFDELGRSVDAEEQYRLAMATGDNIPNATYNLAICLQNQQREQEALETYRTAADLGFKPARWRLADLVRWTDPTQEDLDVWVGTADLKPVAGNDIFEEADGAVTNVCALARDEAGYRRAVVETFRELGLNVVEIDDIEPFQNRAQDLEPDSNSFEIAAGVSRTTPLVYDEFYVYESEEG